MTPSPSLPSELTIYTVGELRPQWLAWLAHVHEAANSGGAQDKTFAVDAAAVAEVDAAGVQLLLSLSNAMRAQHRALRLVGASDPLARACAVLGARALLADADADADGDAEAEAEAVGTGDRT